MKFKFLIAIVLLGFTFGCNQDGSDGAGAGSANTASLNGLEVVDGGYLIQGTAHNFPVGSKVKLEKVKGRSTSTIDTTSVKADGTFAMSDIVAAKDFARIMIDRTPVFIILDNKPINVEVDKNDPRSFTLGGNEEIEALYELNKKAIDGQKFDKAFVGDYVKNAATPHLAYAAMQYLPYANGPEVYDQTLARLKKEIPSNELTVNLGKFIGQEKNKAKSASVAAIGKEAVDLKAKNPEGKEMALTDLKGKVVLIDFWASWCGPCRRENPNVVRAYKEYKNKGFDVFSVSLDSNVDRWQKAIEKDGLVWDSHISDLKKWNSDLSKSYGVRSIPATFLIDKDGKIVAKNLRGRALDDKLKELLG